eukprot:TRINITY_DN3559_c0_g1_i3.p2 TRINITY_DN3559_c0_g1~~TRINITY_DN3559_c0_g1_i3.p2  ORF type:complete len:189 (-),score=59.47 TRINITY_DN3559_c0_g1_i3:1141-1659(-)
MCIRDSIYTHYIHMTSNLANSQKLALSRFAPARRMNINNYDNARVPEEDFEEISSIMEVPEERDAVACPMIESTKSSPLPDTLPKKPLKEEEDINQIHIVVVDNNASSEFDTKASADTQKKCLICHSMCLDIVKFDGQLHDVCSRCFKMYLNGKINLLSVSDCVFLSLALYS